MLKKLLLLALLVLSVNIGSAQNSIAPLVLLINGDLWSWHEGDAQLTRLSQWGYNGEIALKPDGTQVAYHSVAAIVVDVIQRQGGFGGGKLAGNIWVINTDTAEGYRAAEQPPDASFFTPNVPDKVIIRSAPIWSPDGTQFAWTEFDYPESFIRLAIHDTATQQTRIVAEGLPQSTGVIPDALYGDWLETGLVFTHYTLNPQANFVNTSLLVYAPDGTPLAELPIPETEARFVIDIVFMRHDNNDVAGILFNNHAENKLEWMLMDLKTGELAPVPPVIEQVAAREPELSLRLRWMHHPTPNVPAMTALAVLDATNQPINLPLKPGNFITQAVLAPVDGSAVAYQQFNPEMGVNEPELYVWRAGVLTVVPVPPGEFVQEFAWGDLLWRVGE